MTDINRIGPIGDNYNSNTSGNKKAENNPNKQIESRGTSGTGHPSSDAANAAAAYSGVTYDPETAVSSDLANELGLPENFNAYMALENIESGELSGDYLNPEILETLEAGGPF